MNHDHNQGHALKMHKNSFKKIVQQSFFSRRILNSWNSLPKDITEATSLNVFKNKLNNHIGLLKYPADIDSFHFKN